MNKTEVEKIVYGLYRKEITAPVNTKLNTKLNTGTFFSKNERTKADQQKAHLIDRHPKINGAV